MKKILASLLCTIPFLLTAFSNPGADDLIAIQPSPQRSGDAAKGYEYLITGDILKSGVPYSYFTMINGKNETNHLNRTGKNATVDFGYNVIEREGIDVVVPTCLHCHSSTFEGKYVMGLGNTTLDFSDTKSTNFKPALNMLKMTSAKQYEIAKPFLTSAIATFPLMETEVRGVNPADKLAGILVAHRNPKTLEWSDSAMLQIPDEVVPVDVPAWWLLKKKNAMFHNALGRGDFSRFLMLSNLLTVKDTAEAREVSGHFGDVLAYVRTIQAPKYPQPVDDKLAAKGKLLFNDNCSGCHGTYGEGGSYPNFLVPIDVVQTDPMLCESFIKGKAFLDWFENSWFTEGENPAHVVASEGYVAPPLDGVWITAPYMHNGAVPTIEAMLNSKLRPKYWSRDFDKPEYDYKAVGWKYTTYTEPQKKKAYNTTLPGYGNTGHYFGDALTDAERSAVIEYLKTL
ncbi:MAG: c-type cytochrome [Bacteroidetes bacterium]|nr:c-type cytochrome [Bacteroidota bacterium]